ncbi:hypothetical protein HNQ85_000529 [Anoxybacillus calidus]|uniref:DUF3899 domain-containing protein n=1 Tax=[Anoxybacillus] calidus TaxID=575178 RepID=A0A7V9YXH9_9BACL|nr:hypothetical protein [Anoxybacillus calidus]MBA2870271.1 hypothetical protein [Anoxybacillus calidus]
MKKIAFSLLTLGIIAFVNWGVSLFFNADFIEYSFFIGLAFVIKFFNSSGGFTTNLTRLNIQSYTGIKMDEEKPLFTPSIVFYIAIIYTIISLIVTFIYYKNYFV